jgi:GxxExxY protein
MDCNAISKEIVDAAYKVHSRLGPGLMEHVYQACLKIELEKKELDVKSGVFMPVIYDNRVIDIGYRIDLLVEADVIIELKAVREFHEVRRAQLLTYLKLVNKDLGLLINFNVPLIKHGIKRIVNGLEE